MCKPKLYINYANCCDNSIFYLCGDFFYVAFGCVAQNHMLSYMQKVKSIYLAYVCIKSFNIRSENFVMV